VLQQLLHPHNRDPARHSATQVPKLHTCPQGQPPGHAAGEHTKRVNSVGSRAQVRPVGHSPGHCPPQPSAWPQVASMGHRGMHSHTPVLPLHTCPMGQVAPRHTPPQVSLSTAPQASVGEQVR
jgi:hypothetical protein